MGDSTAKTGLHFSADEPDTVTWTFIKESQPPTHLLTYKRAIKFSDDLALRPETTIRMSDSDERFMQRSWENCGQTSPAKTAEEPDATTAEPADEWHMTAAEAESNPVLVMLEDLVLNRPYHPPTSSSLGHTLREWPVKAKAGMGSAKEGFTISLHPKHRYPEI